MAVRSGLGRPESIDESQIWRDKVLEEAKSWVGTPHVHHTLVKGLGADCGLFIIGVYSNIGLIKEDKPEFYPEDWAFHKPVGDMFETIVKRYCVEIKEEELRPGDLILYQFGKCLSHGSLLVDNEYVIHSEKPIGVTMSNRRTSKWFTRERKYYSYKS